MEKKRNFLLDGIIVGFAFFSTMFGAGNLIFPPQIGLETGNQWLIGSIGLVITGVMLPVIAFWSVNNVGHEVRELMWHVHPGFYDFFYLFGCIFVGVGSTLPRCAATAHDMGVSVIFPGVPNWVTMIVFFALTWVFGNDKNKIVDNLGKYLTPVMLVLLAIVLVRGVISPVGDPLPVENDRAFTQSMLTGYLTGDLTVGLMCANIFIGGILMKGYKSESERKKSGIVVGLTAAVCLGAIYVILTYIGASGGSKYDLSIPQTVLLSSLIRDTAGRVGQVLMGIAIVLATLTTSIGIGSTGASVVEDVSKGKISYKLWMTIACIAGAIFGSFGIQNIINYVTPIFLVMYPICIAFTVLGLIDKWLPNDGIYKFGVLVAGIVSIGDAILAVKPDATAVANIMHVIPLSEQGFSWLIPTIIAMIIGGIVYRNKPRTYYNAEGPALESQAAT